MSKQAQCTIVRDMIVFAKAKPTRNNFLTYVRGFIQDDMRVKDKHAITFAFDGIIAYIETYKTEPRYFDESGELIEPDLAVAIHAKNSTWCKYAGLYWKNSDRKWSD